MGYAIQQGSWRAVASADAVQGSEYFSETAPGDDWVWDAVAYRAPTSAEILTQAKTVRKERFNSDATRRILAKYPLEKQSSATLGIYPQAFRDAMASEIASVISASNTACDSVDAATTVAEVDAVIVNWPVI